MEILGGRAMSVINNWMLMFVYLILDIFVYA